MTLTQECCSHEQIGEMFLEPDQYCLDCNLRIHMVKEGFKVIRFVPCLEGIVADKYDLTNLTKFCKCKDKVDLEDGQHLE